ncbi:hypothetical protein BN1058_00119 [Paraliobacillus sp. PM-2]|uniref:recombinase family protein n=1 Tax=Paraliobacillus sp. PM-2 TaxID=1462524 RepID=UPI00061BC7EE|nr:recombinase family protein [Paraliobacillus sp. PM-2]CQR45879.1 hypothetical protein BN1058_00119 [Paraliobacillus sp. PM-2]
MEKVVGYVRVSTKGQVKDGYSLDYQVEEIKKFCKTQKLELVHIYQDKGISGAKVDEEAMTIERDGLQHMLSDLEHLDTTKVIVLNTSRLWRSDIVKVLIQRELKKNRIDIKSIEQPNYSIFNHDPSDFFINGMMELLDQYQRLEITLKLSRGRRRKAQNGGYAGGRATFGYDSKKGSKQLRLNDKQAKSVRELFKLRNEYPTWSLSDLADALNDKGYLTRQNKKFTKVQVKRILDKENFYWYVNTKLDTFLKVNRLVFSRC